MRLCCLFLLLLWCAFPLGAQVETDQDDSTKVYQIDEITTTGTRTARRVIDVPYSIERIDNVQFRFEKKVSVSDVLGVVPGLFFQNRYGNHDVRISIRGFGSRSNSGIRGVRILLDDIPESEPDGQTRIEAIDFQSIGTIEVVKGNSSSLYTNAPGGVINFINDITFPKTFAVNFNQFGSFALSSNGLKAGVKEDKYSLLTSYNYHSSRGYRQHSEDFWHIFNMVAEVRPDESSRLSILGYYVDGLIRLPGSLTKAQFEQDPFQVNARDVGRDAKRITRKGRLGLRYTTSFGHERNNELEFTGYGTTKYFERTARTYRIINRNGFGATVRFVHRDYLFDRPVELSVGTDMLIQNGPVEDYANINGKKGDNLLGITNDGIGNVGFYFQASVPLVQRKLDLLLTGRYDKVVFDIRNQILEVQNDTRRFEAFTPKGALTYKFTPMIAAYTSYGLSFDSPAGNELENYPTSSRTTSILNPDLQPQKSLNFEVGVKGNVVSPKASLLKIVYFDVTFFNSIIKKEIIPFEVFGDVFYRNAAKTLRRGLEVGIDAEIVDGLRLKSAYTLSDFSYDEYVARSVGLDTSGNVVVIEKGFPGNTVPSVPRQNISLALSYELLLADNVTGFIKGTYQNVSGMYTDDENSEKSPGYQLLGSTAGVDIVFGHFDLLVSGGVNNIADTRYIAFINTNSASKEFYEAGEPRNAFGSITLGYQF